MKILVQTTFAACLVSSTALAQVPALSTSWANMTISQEDCLDRAEQALRQHAFRRIERIRESVFGDTKDGRSQAVIRCAPDKQIAFFAMAGPHDREPELTKLINALKTTFGAF
jgi:hypothetical protein